MNLEELGKRVSRRGILLMPPSTALFREKRTDEPDSGLMRNRRSAQHRRMSLPRPSAHLRDASTLEEGPSEDSPGDAGNANAYISRYLQPSVIGHRRSDCVCDGERPTPARHPQVTVKRGRILLRTFTHCTFCLQNTAFFEWSRGNSNPLPPPCKVKTDSSRGFASIHGPA